ncbi:helix-turn-helix transcriptional regulator [Paractinoplanes maris]|uniref:helix-turn-helix transcriptional regulator n=1 Tax=Paractinoplanes maris TaxID=1734446 RepID=UPI002021B759|nr:AAA family ATPase [Actinoplanes maris]
MTTTSRVGSSLPALDEPVRRAGPAGEGSRALVDGTGLVGRASEWAGLGAFLDEATQDGAALLLTGEPGVGKTALLSATADRAVAAGIRVIRGGGVEYESDISFAGLHQLVHPLGAELALLPQPAREVLEAALGFGTGPGPADMAILHAALSLFAEAARERPLLLVVDDLHLLDRASWYVLSFVARRTGGHRLGVLAALRTGIPELPEHLRLPEMPLAPLAEADAIRLLSRRFTGLPRRVITKVADQAQGNPLALLEFGALASASRTTGSGPPGPGSGPARELRADALTPQELEVAELAAASLPTKEIAARLVISPRTVSSHLYRVFPKLGISSRAALRDALTDRQRMTPAGPHRTR